MTTCVVLTLRWSERGWAGVGSGPGWVQRRPAESESRRTVLLMVRPVDRMLNTVDKAFIKLVLFKA